jgi:hypothetical protein
MTSTLLTLVVVPVVYSMLDDAGAWFWRKKRAATTEPASQDVDENARRV